MHVGKPSSGIISCLVVLLLCGLPGVVLSAAGQEGWQILRENGKEGLADAAGNIIIPVAYEEIGWSNASKEVLTDVIGYREHSNWGLIDLKNKRITPAHYQDLLPAGDGHIIASRLVSGRSYPQYGVLSNKGKAIIGFRYRSIYKAGAHYIITQIKEGELKTGLAQRRGEITLPCTYKNIRMLSPGRFAVTDYRDKVSIITGSGKKLVAFALDSICAQPERSDLRIYRRGKVGVITAKGELVHEPRYKQIHPTAAGYELLPFPELRLMQMNQQVLARFRYDSLHAVGDSTWAAYTNDLAWYINQSDALLSKGAFRRIAALNNQLLLIETAAGLGVMDYRGITRLQPRYDSIYWGDGVLWAGRQRKGQRYWSMYDDVGNELSNRRYTRFRPMRERLFAVQRNGLWGFVNSRGKEVITCRYEEVSDYHRQAALANYLGRWGLLSKQGSWLISPQYKHLEPGHGNHYLRREGFRSYLVHPQKGQILYTNSHLYKKEVGYLEDDRYGRYGFRDKQGNVVLDLIYDTLLITDAHIKATRNGRLQWFDHRGTPLYRNLQSFDYYEPLPEKSFLVKEGGRYGMVNAGGEYIIANRYDSLQGFAERRAAYQLIGKWGFINSREQIIVQPNYDSVRHYQAGMAQVWQQGKTGLLNLQGNISLPIIYDQLQRLEGGQYLLFDGKTIGIANKDGRLLAQTLYQQVIPAGAMLLVQYKNKWGLLNQQGLAVVPIQYEYIEYIPQKRLFLTREQ